MTSPPPPVHRVVARFAVRLGPRLRSAVRALAAAAARLVARLARTLLALGLVALALLYTLATRRLYWRKVGGRRWR